ncbi:MAG: flavin reductase family protein [Betaproteobacteria bacterium]
MPDQSIVAADLNADDMYLLLRDAVMPRPIAWVSTIDGQGRTNLAPYSFFNVVSPNPPVLGFSVGPRNERRGSAEFELKDTLLNIRENGEFVVNIVPERFMDQMVRSSDPLPHGDSEFAHTQLVERPSTMIRPPRVAGATVAFECTTYDIVYIGKSAWVMGLVQMVHVEPAAYVGTKGANQHRIDVLRETELRPVGRLGRANYVRLREIETHLRKDGG